MWDGERPELDDCELIRQALGPEQERARAALGTLCRRYQDRVYLWCYRHTGEREQALELAQDTMLAALRGLPTFEHRARFSSWLFAIARNLCSRAIRRRKIWTDPDLDPDQLEGPGGDPAEALAELEDEERARSLLEHALGPEERLAFWLRYYEGMSVNEITRRMGLETSSGARGLLQRARRRLNAAMRQPERERKETL